MSTKIDRNFRSYDGDQRSLSDEYLDPLGEGWAPGSWQDTCKFHKRRFLQFTKFTIVTGGTEDGVDMANECVGNLFHDFVVAGGDRVLSVKGGCKNNIFQSWSITAPGRTVDIEIGNWGHVDQGNPTRNTFINIYRVDGNPVTFCYRFGCKPEFRTSTTKHLWWRSIGITVYWWAKFLAFKVSGGRIK